MLTTYPNVLLISGSGSNVGKTTLSCLLIKKFRQYGVVAVKVTPHWHPQPDGVSIVMEREKLLVLRENDPARKKDSGKMLRSGAERVYYVQNLVDEGLRDAFPAVLRDLGKKAPPMIIESAAFARFFNPALHFHILPRPQATRKENASCTRADHCIRFDGTRFDFPVDSIRWDRENGSWSLANG